MRVITGRFAGRRIECPTGYDIRPTGDKAKGAIFNILNNRIEWEDIVALDVFCGTGNLGIEALSRGAKFASFIDNHKDSLRFTRMNLEQLKIEGEYEVFNCDASKPRPSFKQHNLVFIDPPYRENIAAKVITALDENKWFSDDVLIVLEQGAKSSFKAPTGFVIDDERDYGATKICFLKGAK